uniref:Uncharacterized protein n=1 Tax=Lepeophtheirus salmonis TaxID=72036 RepID=A0A0K2TRT1_LEPSM
MEYFFLLLISRSRCLNQHGCPHWPRETTLGPVIDTSSLFVQLDCVVD